MPTYQTIDELPRTGTNYSDLEVLKSERTVYQIKWPDGTTQWVTRNNGVNWGDQKNVVPGTVKTGTNYTIRYTDAQGNEHSGGLTGFLRQNPDIKLASVPEGYKEYADAVAQQSPNTAQELMAPFTGKETAGGQTAGAYTQFSGTGEKVVGPSLDKGNVQSGGTLKTASMQNESTQTQYDKYKAYGYTDQQIQEYFPAVWSTRGSASVAPNNTTASPATSPTSSVYNIPAGKRGIYRVGADIFDASNGKKIDYVDFMNKWAGKTDVVDLGQKEQPTATTPSSTTNTPPKDTPATPTPTTTAAPTASGEKPAEPVPSPKLPEADIAELFLQGGKGLVKFSTDPDGAGPQTTSTVWLVDENEKTIRPFLSEQSFNNYFGSSTALLDNMNAGAIVTIPTSYLSTALSGYSLKKNDEGISDDGSILNYGRTVNSASLSSLYGANKDETMEQTALTMIDGFMDLIAGSSDSGIDQATLNTIENDPDAMALYVAALSYGGYSLEDVFKDIKRRQLLANGDQSMANTKVIDETRNATTYKATPEGTAAYSNQSLTIPPSFQGASSVIDSKFLGLPIAQMPSEVFQELVPILSPKWWQTEEGKAEMDKIQSAYYDVLMQQADAQTDQQKALADYNWNDFKEQLDKNYGIKLSDNADQAWGQLQQLSSGMSSKQLLNTGIYQEAVDSYLSDVRKGDERLRDEKATSKEAQRRLYYLNSATPEEISALSDEEKIKWGLKPSDDTMNFFSLSNLKSQYPNLTDDELNIYRNSIIDENGNYRSVLYQNLFANKYQLGEEKKLYQQSQVMNKKLNEEEKAYSEFSLGEPYSKSSYNYVAPENRVPIEKPSSSTGITSDAGTSYDKYKSYGYTDDQLKQFFPEVWSTKKTTESPTATSSVVKKPIVPTASSPITNTPGTTPTSSYGTYIPDPSYLSKYSESEIVLDPSGKIYTKKDIPVRW